MNRTYSGWRVMFATGLAPWGTIVDRDGIDLVSKRGFGGSSRTVSVILTNTKRAEIFGGTLTITWTAE